MRALGNNISVCIIPGGQSESIESSSSVRNITLVSRHKGFIRVAIKAGAALLPIFCFGDTKLMDNVNMKALQRKSKNILGFPFPFVPYGQLVPGVDFGHAMYRCALMCLCCTCRCAGLMNFLPIPRSRPIYVVVGTPIAVVQCDEPSSEMVDEVHAKYFGEIRRIFNRHKRAAGFQASNLIYV